MKNGGTFEPSPIRRAETNAMSSPSLLGSTSYVSTGDTSTDLPSIEREVSLLERIRFLEDDMKQMQDEIEELKGSQVDDVEVFEIRKVTIKEAKEEILALLDKSPNLLYLSDIILETKMDPDKVFKAYQSLLKEGKIERTE